MCFSVIPKWIVVKSCALRFNGTVNLLWSNTIRKWIHPQIFIKLHPTQRCDGLSVAKAPD